MSKHLDTKLQRLREDRHLFALARQQGFDTFEIMLYELYNVKRISIEALALQVLHIPVMELRRRLRTLGYEIRSRGGAQTKKLFLSQNLFDEVCKEGVPATAMRLGMSQAALLYQLKKYMEKTQ